MMTKTTGQLQYQPAKNRYDRIYFQNLLALNMSHCLICPEIVLDAYRQGLFPMAESKDGDIYWHFPNPRAVFPLYDLKPPRSLRQSIKKHGYHFTINNRFEDVIKNCSAREDTWISEDITDTYIRLHQDGFAHSVETWSDGDLVGGLYGVSLGGAFFGESMFSAMPDASKAAFFRLVEHLKERKFILLDSQYLNEHTQLLGAIEIPAKMYMALLNRAVNLSVYF